jgi:hypothetical protein
MGRACSMDGEIRNTYRVLAEKPQGKRQLIRSRHRCENNINMDFKEVGCENVDGINLAGSC